MCRSIKQSLSMNILVRLWIALFLAQHWSTHFTISWKAISEVSNSTPWHYYWKLTMFMQHITMKGNDAKKMLIDNRDTFNDKKLSFAAWTNPPTCYSRWAIKSAPNKYLMLLFDVWYKSLLILCTYTLSPLPLHLAQ